MQTKLFMTNVGHTDRDRVSSFDGPGLHFKPGVFSAGKCQDKEDFCPSIAKNGQCSGSKVVKSMCCRSCFLALTGKQDNNEEETTRSRGSTDEMSLEDRQQAALDLFARQPNAPIYYPKGVPHFSPVIKGLLAEGKYYHRNHTHLSLISLERKYIAVGGFHGSLQSPVVLISGCRSTDFCFLPVFITKILYREVSRQANLLPNIGSEWTVFRI